MSDLRKSTADDRDKAATEALELFEGDHAAAEHWLHSPIRGLGYKPPAELVETAVGVELVRTDRPIGTRDCPVTSPEQESPLLVM